MNILTLNSNSSTIKFKIFKHQKKQTLTLLVEGSIEQVYNTKKNIFTIKDCLTKQTQKENVNFDTDFHLNAIKYICKNEIFNHYHIDTIINKIAQGTEAYTEIIVLHDKTLTELSKLNDLAPLNQPYNLMLAKYFMMHYPKIKHYATFDTCFHQGIPIQNRIYGTPSDSKPREITLNGLSHQHISLRLPFLVEHKPAKGRWIVVHLDSSNSICAIKNGKSIATIGGFNLLDIILEFNPKSNSKSVILEQLIEKYKLTNTEINCILSNESKLINASDKTITEFIKAQPNKEDQLKYPTQFFYNLIAGYIAKFITYLNGINGIVFTGAIGENIPQIRSHILEKLECFGFELSKKSNNKNKLRIHKKSSAFKALIVPTNEEFTMLHHFLDRHQ